MIARICRFLPAVFLVMIAPCISSGQEVEISDSTEKYEILTRIKSRYYSYNDHNLYGIRSTITNSLIEQLDSIARALGDKNGLRTTFFKFSTNFHVSIELVNPQVKSAGDKKEKERLADVIKKSEKSLELMLRVVWGVGYDRLFNELKRGYRLLQHDDGYRIVIERQGSFITMEISDEYVITSFHEVRNNVPTLADMEYRTSGGKLLVSKAVVEKEDLPRHEMEVEYQIIDGILVPSQLRLQGAAAEEIFKAAGLPAVDTGLVYRIDNYKLKYHK